MVINILKISLLSNGKYMNHFFRNIFIFLFVLLFISTCKKEDNNELEMGYEYYPVNLGAWYIYSVDSTFYDDFDSTINTLSYQIKEVYADTFTDLEGRLSYTINRYKRDNDSSDWIKSDVWYETITECRVERIEEDVRYEPLIFPVKNDAEWDLNSFNSYSVYNKWGRLDNTKMQIMIKDTLVGETYKADSLTYYENTATIFYEFSTYVNYEFYQAIYAKDIGLVYKKMTYYYYYYPIIPKYGVNYVQKLISYNI
jgi:hypothetical protein